jgi:hypothetical protein
MGGGQQSILRRPCNKKKEDFIYSWAPVILTPPPSIMSVSPPINRLVPVYLFELKKTLNKYRFFQNSPRAPYVNKLITVSYLIILFFNNSFLQNPQSFNELSKTIEIQVKEKQNKMKREEMSKNAFVNAQIDSIRMRVWLLA